MNFKVGDTVTIHANEEELQEELFQEIDGAFGEISEIYSNTYEPGVKRYEITLSSPATVNGEELIVVDGLYADNLELANADEAVSHSSDRYAVTFESHLENDSLNWYYGIADCHGIESFIMEPSQKRWTQMDRLKELGLRDEGSAEDPEKKKFGGSINMLMMRARANAQRHPVVYRVLLSDEDADSIKSMIEDGEYDNALIFLKDSAQETQIARRFGINPERAWSMIPNHELDPHWG